MCRDGHQSAYEKEASYIYGLLREAWERGLEEVLLGGVVERFRPTVQTRQVTKIADITEEDCKIPYAAMTKCSKWLPGHDQAAAARAEVPGRTFSGQISMRWKIRFPAFESAATEAGGQMSDEQSLVSPSKSSCFGQGAVERH